MKKLVVTLVMILSLASVSFGQSFFGKSSNEQPMRDGEGSGMMFPGHGGDDDYDADGPLGSGIAVLIGLGGAYMLAKKKKNK